MNKKFILSILLTVFFLWLAARGVHFSVVLENLNKFNLALLLVGLFFWLLGYWFRGLRWKILLSNMENVSAVDSFKILVSGFAMNDVLPMRAGEFARAYLLHRRFPRVSSSAAFATIAVERLFDGICVLLLTLIGTVGMSLPTWIRQAEVFAAMIFGGAGVAFLILVFTPHYLKLLKPIMLKVFPEKWVGKLISLVKNFAQGLEVFRSFDKLTGAVIYSAIAWLLEVVFYYLTAHSFHINLSILNGTFLMGIINLGVMIPAGPGGVGAFQWVAVQALGLFGIDNSVSFSYGVIVHMFANLSIILMGGFFLWQMGIKNFNKLVKTNNTSEAN